MDNPTNPEAFNNKDELNTEILSLESDKRLVESGTVDMIGVLREKIREFHLKPEEQERLDQALLLMILAHRKHIRRSGEPYLNHTLRVTALLVSEEVKDPTVIAAAMLHDSLEDGLEELCEYTGHLHLGRKITDKLNNRYPDEDNRNTVYKQCLVPRVGKDVADLVWELSVPKKPDNLTDEGRRVYYRQKVEKIIEAPRAALIKLADVYDNSPYHEDRHTAREIHQTKKYIPILKLLRERLNEGDMGLSPSTQRFFVSVADEAFTKSKAYLDLHQKRDLG